MTHHRKKSSGLPIFRDGKYTIYGISDAKKFFKYRKLIIFAPYKDYKITIRYVSSSYRNKKNFTYKSCKTNVRRKTGQGYRQNSYRNET